MDESCLGDFSRFRFGTLESLGKALQIEEDRLKRSGANCSVCASEILKSTECDKVL